MASLAATPELQRERLYAALVRRNRLVGVLRFALPLAGAALLVVVLAGIVYDNLREQFSFSSVRIDRDNLIVETPRVTAVGDDGTLYAATAQTAKVRVDSTELIDMVDAVFSMQPLDGPSYQATAPTAALQTKTQVLTVPDTVTVSGDNGLRGTLADFHADMLGYQMRAHGAVDLTFPEGMQVQSEGMSYDGNAKLWTFSRATVILPETPGGAVEETPPVMEVVQ